MNSINRTKLAKEDPLRGALRPFTQWALNDLNLITGDLALPLSFVAREPLLRLPSPRATRLSVIILALSWERLGEAEAHWQFGGIGGRFLRLQLGEAGRPNNDRLDAAFAELTQCRWRFPIALDDDQYSEAPLLTGFEKERRIYTWTFSPVVIDLMRAFPLWIGYPIEETGLSDALSLRVHELLLVFLKRQYPVWRVPIAELRDLLGFGNVQITDLRFFKTIVEPALRRVETQVNWRIDAKPMQESVMGPPLGLVLKVARRSTRGADTIAAE